MPKKYPAEVHDRAVPMALDRLNDRPSVWAACLALAPKLDVGAETLRKWIKPRSTLGIVSDRPPKNWTRSRS